MMFYYLNTSLTLRFLNLPSLALWVAPTISTMDAVSGSMTPIPLSTGRRSKGIPTSCDKTTARHQTPPPPDLASRRGTLKKHKDLVLNNKLCPVTTYPASPCHVASCDKHCLAGNKTRSSNPMMYYNLEIGNQQRRKVSVISDDINYIRI
jgi:hypothetical protein